MSRTPATAAAVAGLLVVHAVQAGVAVVAGWQTPLDALVGERDVLTRIRLGGQYLPLVHEGELGRLASSLVVHVDLLHLGFNALALALLGQWLERPLGAARWLALWVLGGLAGSVLSQLASVAQSDGISGAAYAGAVLLGVWALRGLPTVPLDRRAGALVLLWVAVSVWWARSSTLIDAASHLGGALVGLALGLAWRPGRGHPAWWTVVGVWGAVVVSVWALR